MANYFKDNFDWDFGLFLSNIQLVASKVSDSIVRFNECLKSQSDAMSEDVEIIEDFGTAKMPGDLAACLISLMKNLKNEVFYNSLLITAYSYLEFSLIEYCKLIEGYLTKDIRIARYKQSGILKAKFFLHDAFDLDISDLENWNQIDAFRIHRNIIIHNNSSILHKQNRRLQEQKYFGLFADNKSVEIAESGRVFISDSKYIDSLLALSTHFLANIIEATKGKVETYQVPPNEE